MGSERIGRLERRQGKVSPALVANHVCVSDILLPAWLRVFLHAKPWFFAERGLLRAVGRLTSLENKAGAFARMIVHGIMEEHLGSILLVSGTGGND